MRWYDDQCQGLGSAFLAEFSKTVRLIAQDPERQRLYQGKWRRIMFATFPYAIIYLFEESTVYIQAVPHLHRRPGYWRSRSWK